MSTTTTTTTTTTETATVEYLDRTRVGYVKVAARTARGQVPVATLAPASGYGDRIPTRYMVQLSSADGVRRWHRVYVMCYGNGGTAYVMADGGRRYVLDAATEADCERIGRYEDANPIGL